MKKNLALILVLFAMLLLSAMPALAQTPTASQGGIVLASPFTAIIGAKGNTITFSLELVNNGAGYEELQLKAGGPADWAPTFKQGGYTVRSVMVGPSKTQNLDFQIKPTAEAAAGDYNFSVQALRKDGTTAAELALSVLLEDKIAPTGLKMTTDYPDNSGQVGTSFSWRVSLVNNSDQPRTVNFSADLPPSWDASFKAGYDQRKVTSLSVEGGSTTSVNVDINTAYNASAGPYDLVLRAVADQDVAELPLKITLTGTSKLSLTTSTGLLNTKATVDKESQITLVVKNTGTAPLEKIKVTSSRPDGWEATFNPEEIAQLPVGESAEVNATLKPTGSVLTGDYELSMTASAGAATDSKNIRVTVETSTKWGIAAIAAIVVIVGGLLLIFARFSRR